MNLVSQYRPVDNSVAVQKPKPEQQEPPKAEVEVKKVEQEATKETTETKAIVKTSKNPDRIANSAGVVAGTSGMIGGAVLGGTVGLYRLPGETIKTLASQNYSQLAAETVTNFTQSIKSNTAIQGMSGSVSGLLNEIKSIKSPEAAEEFLQIAKTMSERLNTTFANDEAAKNVINKIFDPLVSSVSVNKNKKGIIGCILTKLKKKPKTEIDVDDIVEVSKKARPLMGPKTKAIMKFLGFPVTTTTVVSGFSANITKHIGAILDNIQNFTPEEKVAWRKVAGQMSTELATNPKIIASKNMLGHLKTFGESLKELTQSTDWIEKPIKALQESIVEGARNLNKGLTKTPIKSIGLFALAGSAICGTIATAGWFGLKKLLMPKEKIEKPEVVAETQPEKNKKEAA